MKKLILMFLFLPLLGHALEVDEKLTVRIIKTSETRKTILVNRGTEDGLVEGDHAKFIMTAGIVARAVCVRVSPTRSVWSVYRLVNADYIVNDSVMSLKITPPVKITKDETQALVQEDTPTRTSGDVTTLGIPLADGAQDLNTADENLSNADLKALEESNVPSSIVEKNLEVLGFINISGLTANSKTEVGDESYNSSQTFYHIGLGGEWYAQREREWYSRFSLIGGVSFMRENTQAYNGASILNELTEFNFGLNWHPFKLPSAAGEFIPYFHGSVHLGTVQSTFTSGTTDGISVPQDLSSNGGTNGFSVGFGYKFYTRQGFGARFLLDYYLRNEKYSEDDLLNSHDKTVGGPRLMAGLSYRF